MYKVPLMNTQGTLFRMKGHAELINGILDEKIKRNKHNWGIKRGKGYKVTFELERQWYLVYSSSNRWVIQYLLELIFE